MLQNLLLSAHCPVVVLSISSYQPQESSLVTAEQGSMVMAEKGVSAWCGHRGFQIELVSSYLLLTQRSEYVHFVIKEQDCIQYIDPATGEMSQQLRTCTILAQYPSLVASTV